MTCPINTRRLAASILALILFYIHSSAFAAAGRTVGSFQVSPAGAATYDIPIFAPRGPNGLQPRIALAYNSQSGNGYLGVGWGLSGVSSLYRCKQTFAQDPTAAPVTLTMSDVFCMDGQRLRLTTSGGTYGSPNTTYQTEVANFANVTAYGSAGNGPAYFEVQGRDGRSYEYGNTADSQVQANGTAWVWYLDKVTDRAGNTMTFSYCTDDTDGNPNSFCTQSGATASGTAVPVTISWTPSVQGASSYNYTMQFAYSTNVPEVSVYGYVGGVPYSETNLLTSISVNYTGTTVKKYVLTYAQSPTTARDTLSTLQECADAGATNCLPATTLKYQSGEIGVSTNSETAISNTFAQVAEHDDFNGDGIDDLAYCSGTPTTIYVAFGSTSGYGTPVSTDIPCTVSPVYADLDAGGKDGILVPNGTDWWYYTWNGSSFSGEDTTLQYDSAAFQYVVADVNGDGYPDLVSLYHTSGTWYIDVRLNISAGNISTCISSTVCFSDNNSEWYGPVSDTQTGLFMTANTDGSDAYGTLKGLDFNGDGRQDLALQVVTSGTTLNTYELLSGTSSFTPIAITMASARARNPTTFLNFNSDGCTDYAFNGVIYISGCNGTVAQQIGLNGATIIGAMDWDGDGYTDILVANGSTIGVYLSEGNGISGLQTTSISYDSSDVYFAFDADGDGLDDLGAYPGTGSGITYYLHNGVGEKPDLLNSVTDGFGNFAKPAYVSLPQGTGSTYSPGMPSQLSDRIGYAEDTDPLYVVRSVTYSDPTDPSNSTYTGTYSYSDAIKDIQGIGFVGFATQMAADSRTGVYETFGYYQVFPEEGMLQSDVATQSNNTQKTIFNRSYSISNYVLDSNEYNFRLFPVVDTTDEEYEVGGSEDGQLIRTTTISNDSPDSNGNEDLILTTVTDNDPASPYVNESWTTKVTNTFDADQSTWCLTLVRESQVLYSASDGSTSVTRTRDYTPDTANCRYTQVTTEPSSNTYKVIETLGYDDFGNINSDTVAGAGMAARQTTASWGTTGQFPISITDASGAQTQFDYNFGYGLLSKETDPNGLTTSWAYGDGFGRVTQETRPDLTYTKYYYNACGSSNNYCGNSDKPDLRLFLQKQFFGADGSLLDERDLYENSVDAVRLNSIYNLSGKVYIDTHYDALGRVIEQSVPHFTTEYDTTYSYDVRNRVVQTQRPTNQNDSTPQTMSYTYQGDTTTITDPNSNTQTLVRGPNGWLREAKDALGYAVFLGYDAAGSKISASDNLNNGPSKPLWTGTYVYGVAPFLIGEVDVDRGTWGYTVDALGERTAWTDPKGQQFTESYDALSRPVTRTEPDLFTQWTWGSSVASHNIGKLANVCTGTGSACSSSFYSESDTYDSLGRMYQRTLAIPGMGTDTYTWLYSSTTGLLDTLTYPVSTAGQALKLKYAYHTGLLQSITDVLDSPNVTIWQANAQNAYNQPSEETFGNGLVVSRAYDAVTDWLASVQSGPGGGASVQNQSFLYDEIGNVTQRQDNNLGLTENFYYDGDYRLGYSTLNGTQNLSLNYDQTGNITSRSDVASGATWTYDPVRVHEVTQAGSSAYNYAYDANGNATSRQGSSITWTSYNYPATVSDSASGETVSFSYGPDRQVWLEETQSPSGTDLNYRVGGLLDIVSSGGVTDYRHYIYAGSEPVAIDSRKSNGTNTFSYLLSDQEGSIADITDNSGGVVVGEGFTAYGSRRNPTTWSGAPSSSDLSTIAGITRRGYTFQEALGEMGLNDMVGRVQDAITGRFLSADPTIPHPMNSQSYNPYSYVENNPLTNADPTGFCDLSVTNGQDGNYAYEFTGCEVDAPREPAPDVCIGCFYPMPESPPTWPGPSTFPAPGGPTGPTLGGTPRSANPPTRPARPPGRSSTQCAQGQKCNPQQSNQPTPCPTGQTSSGAVSSVHAPFAPLPNSLSGGEIVGTVGALNDLGGAGATAVSEIGGSATGVAGTVARGSPVVAGVISGGVLLHGVASGNSQQEFDGTYGLVTLGVAIFQPYIGLGMAIGKVLGDVAAPNDNDPNILEEAALAAPTTQCPATK